MNEYATGYVESPATVGDAGIKMSASMQASCLGLGLVGSDMLSGKCESPVAITATAEVSAGLKMTVMVGGVDMGSRPHRRWLARARKCGGGNGKLTKRLLHQW